MGWVLTLCAGAGWFAGFLEPDFAREIIQNWGDEDNDYLDMATDLLVWTLGATAASLVF